MKIHFSLTLFLVILAVSCQKEAHTELLQGHYRAALEITENEELPFNFEVINDSTIEIYNAEEIIIIDDISYANDSVRINFPVFEGYIAGRFEDGKMYDGKFIKESLDRVVPIQFHHDKKERFLDVQPAEGDVSGIWEMLFKEDDGSTFIGKGIFHQDANKVTGTIRTTTGDYRYLEGALSGETMKISAFDGAHAFLFTALATDSLMTGTFYSGNHYKASFTAKPNTEFELPHEDTLTFLKEGYDAIEFAFPDVNDRLVSLEDARFKNKVVVVQIMGTWCPNCLDESRYYTEYYKQNKDQGLEFVALAFEYARTKEKAFEGIMRLQERLEIEYPILLAQYGTSDKKKAQEKLPMLDHVLSYPTTIFIDKKGKVRKIHTGFNGPATGEKYTEFKKEFDGFLAKLLAE